MTMGLGVVDGAGSYKEVEIHGGRGSMQGCCPR